jgi:hypothetical protein
MVSDFEFTFPIGTRVRVKTSHPFLLDLNGRTGTMGAYDLVIFDGVSDGSITGCPSLLEILPDQTPNPKHFRDLAREYERLAEDYEDAQDETTNKP